MQITLVFIDLAEHWVYGHFLKDLFNLFFFTRQCHFMKDIIGKKFHEIKIGDVFIYSVTYINIIESVIVHIKHQSTPTPVCSGHSAIVSYVKKFSILII